MNQLEKSVKKHALNAQDMYQSLNIKPEKSLLKRFLIPATVLTSLLLTIFFGSLVNAPTQKNIVNTTNAIAYFQLEINPQFEIAVDEDGFVVEIKALNEDAETFELDIYLNQKVEEVVEQLIVLATEKGFINADDDVDDFVTITSVLIDEDEKDNMENVESIGYKIRSKIQASSEVDPKTNVVFVKATIREKMEAQDKEIPLGMYVIHGMVDVDGEMLQVNEYVKNENALEKMNKAGIIITKREQNQSNQPTDVPNNDNKNNLEDDSDKRQDNDNASQNNIDDSKPNSNDPLDKSNENNNKGSSNSKRP